MLKKIKQFIKYNTLTAIIIAVAFVAVASVMAANEDVKKVIGEEIIEKTGIDNSVLLAADLENFDLKMKITNAMEDEENYYIDYQYNTLAIKDNVWQEVLVEKQMTVSKASLDGRDLGLYVVEELGEIIDYQLAFLIEVQEKEEEEKGETFVTEITEYTGLIGLVFDTKTKELPGYEPVIKLPVSEVVESSDNQEDEENNNEEIGNWILDIDETSDDDFVEDSAYYEFLIDNCLSDDGYWYNNTCNAEAEVVEEEEESKSVEDLESGEEVKEDLAEDELIEPVEEESIEDEPTVDEEDLSEEATEDAPAEEPAEEPETGDQGDEDDLEI